MRSSRSSTRSRDTRPPPAASAKRSHLKTSLRRAGSIDNMIHALSSGNSRSSSLTRAVAPSSLAAQDAHSETSSSLNFVTPPPGSNGAHSFRGRSTNGRHHTSKRASSSGASSRHSTGPMCESPFLAQPPGSNRSHSSHSQQSHSHRPRVSHSRRGHSSARSHSTSFSRPSSASHSPAIPAAYPMAAHYMPQAFGHRGMPFGMPGMPAQRGWGPPHTMPPAPYYPAAPGGPSPFQNAYPFGHNTHASQMQHSGAADPAALQSAGSVRSEGVILPTAQSTQQQQQEQQQSAGQAPADAQAAAQSSFGPSQQQLPAQKTSKSTGSDTLHSDGNAGKAPASKAGAASSRSRELSRTKASAPTAPRKQALAPEHSYQKQAASQVSQAFSPKGLAHHRALSGSSSAGSGDTSGRLSMQVR